MFFQFHHCLVNARYLSHIQSLAKLKDTKKKNKKFFFLCFSPQTPCLIIHESNEKSETEKMKSCEKSKIRKKKIFLFSSVLYILSSWLANTVTFPVGCLFAAFLFFSFFLVCSLNYIRTIYYIKYRIFREFTNHPLLCIYHLRFILFYHNITST